MHDLSLTAQSLFGFKLTPAQLTALQRYESELIELNSRLVEGLIGSEGVAKTGITRDGGMVSLHGEIWSAFSDEEIRKDEKVFVEAVSGLQVKVSKIKGGP